MKYLFILLLSFASCFGGKETHSGVKPPVSFYDFKVATLEGDMIDFSQYKGKKLLIVNTASKCGYTSQYADLQKLYQHHKDKLVVLGFPSNDFMNQEPGDAKQIREFCTRNYGVSFTIFEKVSVKGSEKHPVFQWLSDKSKNGWNDNEPKWNFNKYVINEKGELTHYFGSGVEPLSEDILKAIK